MYMCVGVCDSGTDGELVGVRTCTHVSLLQMHAFVIFCIMIWHLLSNTTVTVQEKYNIVQRHFKRMIEKEWVVSTCVTQPALVV